MQYKPPVQKYRKIVEFLKNNMASSLSNSNNQPETSTSAQEQRERRLQRRRERDIESMVPLKQWNKTFRSGSPHIMYYIPLVGCSNPPQGEMKLDWRDSALFRLSSVRTCGKLIGSS